MNLILSIIIGAITSVMLLYNGILSDTVGTFTSVTIIHLIGLVSILLVLIIKKSKFNLKGGIPFYLYSAGAIGVITVVFTNLSVINLGVSLTLAIGLLGQSIISILIDHHGFFGLKIIKFNRKKMIGLFIIAFGIFIMTIY